MNRIDNIIENPLFIKNYKLTKKYEKNRKYCKHNMRHFLDVARIAYIISLEENKLIDKEIIYATALLHDIGRHLQYSNDIPHEKASAKIAPRILEEAGFNKTETDLIIEAILGHRDKQSSTSILDELICRADKLSRPCYYCKVSDQCNWSEDKKNKSVI